MDISKVKEVTPHILMGMGIAFSGTATVEGIIQTFKLSEDGYGRDYIHDKNVPLKEKVMTFGRYYWKVGVPSAIALGCFMGSMKGYSAQVANAVSIAAWYKQYAKEYQAKNRELYGEENDKAVKDAIVKDHMSKNPPPAKRNSEAYMVYEPVTDQYFEVTMKEVDNCEREMNRILNKACPVDFEYFLKYFKNAKHDKPICKDIGWFLDDSYVDYHYWNESFFAHQLFEIFLDPQEIDGEDIYVMRCSIEPMLNLELDADVVKDSQDLQRL